MILTEEQREWLKRKAFERTPNESCGFILDDGEIIEIANIHPEPYRGFSMAGTDILNKLDNEALSRIVAVWHTHPKGTTTPSMTDIGSIRQGAILRKWDYLIATKDEVSQWNCEDFIEKDDSFWERFKV